MMLPWDGSCEKVMIALKKITHDNLQEIVGLSVAENQRGFVASNAQSIMDAYVAITNDGIALPFGIYDGEEAVGFIMLTYGMKKDAAMPDVAYHNYCVWRLMIDEEHQGKEYGKQAMEAALEYMRTFPCGPAESCWLNYEPENAGAKAFYEKCGFQETGERFFGEIVAMRRL